MPRRGRGPYHRMRTGGATPDRRAAGPGADDGAVPLRSSRIPRAARPLDPRWPGADAGPGLRQVAVGGAGGRRRARGRLRHARAGQGRRAGAGAALGRGGARPLRALRRRHAVLAPVGAEPRGARSPGPDRDRDGGHRDRRARRGRAVRPGDDHRPGGLQRPLRRHRRQRRSRRRPDAAAPAPAGGPPGRDRGHQRARRGPALAAPDAARGRSAHAHRRAEPELGAGHRGLRRGGGRGPRTLFGRVATRRSAGRRRLRAWRAPRGRAPGTRGRGTPGSFGSRARPGGACRACRPRGWRTRARRSATWR